MLKNAGVDCEAVASMIDEEGYKQSMKAEGASAAEAAETALPPPVLDVAALAATLPAHAQNSRLLPINTSYRLIRHKARGCLPACVTEQFVGFQEFQFRRKRVDPSIMENRLHAAGNQPAGSRPHGNDIRP